MKKIYLGTVALENNRWAEGRKPSFLVSDFLDRVKKDGFSGIELWENHFMLADREEQKKLMDADVEYIFNSYLSLKEGITDEVKKVAEAIKNLGAVGVKYNFSFRDFNSEPGYTQQDYVEQTDTLLRFAELLPPDVKLLCECHANTLMENPERAGKVFERLDERFGAIIHLVAERELAKGCFDCYGNRICHIHTANPIGSGKFDNLKAADERMKDNFSYFISRGFQGTVTVEFVKSADEPEGYYEGALADLAYLKQLYPD